MLLSKREEKKLTYRNDWFISEINFNGRTYYSKDGFSFSHSRQERTTLKTMLNSPFKNSMQVLSVENNNGDVICLNEKIRRISLDVKEMVITLKVHNK